MTTIKRLSNLTISQFTCPYCHSPLTPNAKTWHCDGSLNPKNTQHPFDVARQGYVNLLPVQNKKSKDPGDSQASIEARHRFLSQGFYQPLQQLVTALISKLVNDVNQANNDEKCKTWLDIGCGEGYYTQLLTQPLIKASTSVSAEPTISPNNSVDGLIAIDISKPAVSLFAKTAKQNHQLWSQIASKQPRDNPNTIAIYPIVASAAKLPIADRSIVGISSIFSPILPAEFARVLQKEGGRLLIAKPDVEHLQTLRHALFDEVRPHDSDKFLDELAPHFKLLTSHRVQADLALDKQALADLLTMTPYSYRAKAEKREALLAMTQTEMFKTQARFVVYELVKV